MTLTQIILHLNVHLFTRRGVFCAHHPIIYYDVHAHWHCRYTQSSYGWPCRPSRAFSVPCRRAAAGIGSVSVVCFTRGTFTKTLFRRVKRPSTNSSGRRWRAQRKTAYAESRQRSRDSVRQGEHESAEFSLPRPVPSRRTRQTRGRGKRQGRATLRHPPCVSEPRGCYVPGAYCFSSSSASSEKTRVHTLNNKNTTRGSPQPKRHAHVLRYG